MGDNYTRAYLNGAVMCGGGLFETISDSSVKPVAAAETACIYDNSVFEPFDTGLKGNEVIFVCDITTGGTLTVKAGTGLQGTQDIDVVFDTGIYILRLEPGKFLQTKNYIDEDEATHCAGTVEFKGDGTVAGSIYPIALAYCEAPEEDNGGGGGL